MTLIVGGAGQGKLEYVLKKTGCAPEDVARTPEQALTRPIFFGVEAFPGLDEEALLAANPRVILICREVGCGVVPAEEGERRRREQVGRLCCRLAKRADRVERIFCGLAMVLKGAPEWS